MVFDTKIGWECNRWPVGYTDSYCSANLYWAEYITDAFLTIVGLFAFIFIHFYTIRSTIKKIPFKKKKILRSSYIPVVMNDCIIFIQQHKFYRILGEKKIEAVSHSIKSCLSGQFALLIEVKEERMEYKHWINEVLWIAFRALHIC